MRINFEAITPVVLRRGAIQSQRAFYYYSAISGSSIKGILRWWFRFLLGEKISEKSMLKAEEKVFGTTNKAVGASPIAVYSEVKEESIEDWYTLRLRRDSYVYFKKFRLSINRNQGVKVIKPSGKFYVELAQNRLNVENAEELLEIYRLLFEVISLFGGMGPGWRRTLGSIQIEDKTYNNVSDFSKKLQEISEELFNKLSKISEVEVAEGSNRDLCFPNLQSSKFYFYNKRLSRDPLNAVNEGIRALLDIRRILKRRGDPVARALFGYPLGKAGIHIEGAERAPSPFIITVKRIGGNYRILAILSEYLGNCCFTISYSGENREVTREASNAFNIIENAIESVGFHQV